MERRYGEKLSQALPRGSFVESLPWGHVFHKQLGNSILGHSVLCVTLTCASADAWYCEPGQGREPTVERGDFIKICLRVGFLFLFSGLAKVESLIWSSSSCAGCTGGRQVLAWGVDRCT